MVKSLIFVLVLMSGCAIRATRAHDATLPYHPTLDELRSAPLLPADTGPNTGFRPFPTQVEFLGLTSAYPQPIGLDYNYDGAFRRLIGVEWNGKEFEDALAVALPMSPRSAGRALLHADGAIVSLAVYRVDAELYAQAMLEVRIARDGAEVYAARYSARLRGDERASLLVALANQLVSQIGRDDQLVAAIAKDHS